MQYSNNSALPVFYHPGLRGEARELVLPEDVFRHAVAVLRMKEGEEMLLADGKGRSATGTIARCTKKECIVKTGPVEHHEERKPLLHLAVAFTKNTGRNEWLLEKITELGVKTIIPLITARTERERFRPDRWNSILVSAMMQSRQWHLPSLTAPVLLKNVIAAYAQTAQKFIAHCNEGEKANLRNALPPHKESLILIGPEGDFTGEEVALCLSNGFTGIALGDTRLRTETAAVAACACFHMINSK